MGVRYIITIACMLGLSFPAAGQSVSTNGNDRKLSSICSSTDVNGSLKISFFSYWIRFRVDPPPLDYVVKEGELRGRGLPFFLHSNEGRAICDQSRYKPMERINPKHYPMTGRVVVYQDGMSPENFIVMDMPSTRASDQKVRIRNGTMIGEIENEYALDLILNSVPSRSNPTPKECECNQSSGLSIDKSNKEDKGS